MSAYVESPELDFVLNFPNDLPDAVVIWLRGVIQRGEALSFTLDDASHVVNFGLMTQARVRSGRPMLAGRKSTDVGLSTV